MRYNDSCKGTFLTRYNRFIALVEIDGQKETVHVKNTGRCRELLVPGAEVWLAKSDNPARKTKYDLIAVRKSTGVLFNIDSQAPNAAAGEWLAKQGFDRIVPEYPFGQSRIDFYMERGGEKYLLEVNPEPYQYTVPGAPARGRSARDLRRSHHHSQHRPSAR